MQHQTIGDLMIRQGLALQGKAPKGTVDADHDPDFGAYLELVGTRYNRLVRPGVGGETPAYEESRSWLTIEMNNPDKTIAALAKRALGWLSYYWAH
jgi:hypothetical protein